MRRTSFRVVMSITLTDALAELTMKAMPPACAAPRTATRAAPNNRDNKVVRRCMTWDAPAGIAPFPTPPARNRARLFRFRPGKHRGGECEHDTGGRRDQHVVGQRVKSQRDERKPHDPSFRGRQAARTDKGPPHE